MPELLVFMALLHEESGGMLPFLDKAREMYTS